MRRTLADDAEGPERELPDSVRRRRALTETRAVLEQADARYAPFRCQGTAECCALSTTGRPPWLWPTEWALLLERLRRDARPVPPPRHDGGCALLDATGRRCTVYADRPFGCRTFFCARVEGPARQPSLATDALLQRLGALNLELDPAAAPRPLPELFERALVSPPY